MTREEAIHVLKEISAALKSWSGFTKYPQAIDMAIEALQIEPIKCEECRHQNECEEVVLFDVNDEEVMGHHIHWCSYGRSEK